MMRGIDISSWQEGMDVSEVIKRNDLGFVIAKATEGVAFVDSTCDRFVQSARNAGACWGFYHFARNNDPVKEADYFYTNTKNYFGEGVPVLDIEDSSIPDWSAYAKRFADRIHALTGVYPMIYVSAGACWRFSDNDAFKNCALWVAGYPRTIKYWSNDLDREFDYSIYPWAQATIWQFSGQGDIYGYNGNVDLDIGYLDAEAWHKIATGGKGSVKPKPQPKLDSVFVTACKVIAGLYGNGQERFDKLEAAGYDVDEVQDLVNEMVANYA